MSTDAARGHRNQEASGQYILKLFYRNQIFATQIHLVKPPKLLQQLITNYNFELPEDTAFILRSVTLINTELSLLRRKANKFNLMNVLLI